jgi:hypothetical protein
LREADQALSAATVAVYRVPVVTELGIVHEAVATFGLVARHVPRGPGTTSVEARVQGGEHTVGIGMTENVAEEPVGFGCAANVLVLRPALFARATILGAVAGVEPEGRQTIELGRPARRRLAATAVAAATGEVRPLRLVRTRQKPRAVITGSARVIIELATAAAAVEADRVPVVASLARIERAVAAESRWLFQLTARAAAVAIFEIAVVALLFFGDDAVATDRTAALARHGCEQRGDPAEKDTHTPIDLGHGRSGHSAIPDSKSSYREPRRIFCYVFRRIGHVVSDYQRDALCDAAFLNGCVASRRAHCSGPSGPP